MRAKGLESEPKIDVPGNRCSHPVKGFDLAFELDEEWLAFAVYRFACRYFDPTFAHAILFDIEAFLVIEANPDVVLENSGHMVRAALVDGQAVWQGRGLRDVVHG